MPHSQGAIQHFSALFIPAEILRIEVFSPASKDLVNRSLIERDHKEIAVGSGLYIGDDSEVSSDQKTLAFRHLVKG